VQIVAADELDMYTQLGTTTLTQRVLCGYTAKFSLVAELLGDMFDDVRSPNEQTVLVFDAVSVSRLSDAAVAVEWIATPVNDMLADSVLACIAQAQSSPAAVKGALLFLFCFTPSPIIFFLYRCDRQLAS
jgi:hypothetical protein